METEVKKNRFATRGLGLIGIILAILLILFILGWLPKERTLKKADSLAAEHNLPKVEVVAIQPNTNPIELDLPSSAQAWHITPIWARTNGYLTNFVVDIGDRVKEGDLLAVIDTPEVDQQLEQAKAELANSIALYNIAKITADRWQTLYTKNAQAVTKQEVDQYNANLAAAKATVTANQKNVFRLTYLQQFKNVYAPFDGIISARYIDIGTLITGNLNDSPQQLFQIAQTKTIRFYTQVPQNYFRQIKEDLEVDVIIQEFPDRVFKGKVARFANALLPNQRTMMTEVDVENPDGLIYPGLYAVARYKFVPDTINFIIPTTAIIIRAGHPHIAVVDDNNIVHLKKVQIGRDYGKNMEIMDGLQTGERVIVIPSDAIVEGAKVEIIDPKPFREVGSI